MGKVVANVTLLVLGCAVLTGQAFAGQRAYISGDSEPWTYVAPTNLSNMDAAFGAGNWSRLTFSNAVSTGIFDPGEFCMLFIDGGDGNTLEWEGWLNSNRTSLESFVSGGGHLFMTAARWDDSSDFDLGFGATLHSGASNSATAVDASHPIFNGPMTPTGTSWTGTSFSHDYISWAADAGFASLIVDEDGRTVLTERDYGSGLVLLGGMTVTAFHDPDPQADNLRVNTLIYTDQGSCSPVPEPASLALLTGGVLPLALRKLRRRQTEPVAQEV
jgi:hypothetical protein